VNHVSTSRRRWAWGGGGLDHTAAHATAQEVDCGRVLRPVAVGGAVCFAVALRIEAQRAELLNDADELTLGLEVPHHPPRIDHVPHPPPPQRRIRTRPPPHALPSPYRAIMMQ
jgi:hypothetical protein